MYSFLAGSSSSSDRPCSSVVTGAQSGIGVSVQITTDDFAFTFAQIPFEKSPINQFYSN